MKEIIIRIKNPHCNNEVIYSDNNLNGLELIIDGQPVHQVKRFAIDINTQTMLDEGYKDISYTLEKYLNIHEMYYDNTDHIRTPEDWEKVKNR